MTAPPLLRAPTASHITPAGGITAPQEADMVDKTPGHAPKKKAPKKEAPAPEAFTDKMNQKAGAKDGAKGGKGAKGR